MRGNIKDLMATLPQQGRVVDILLRPAKGEMMLSVEKVEAKPGEGLIGDRFKGRIDSKRQVTIFQYENLAVLASFLQRSSIDPRLLRRNLIIEGINLHALSGRTFKVGNVLLEGAAQCHPCSKMEVALGAGGFNAMRGIGGLCARILEGGDICRGNSVVAYEKS